jgi:hypothetical protein
VHENAYPIRYNKNNSNPPNPLILVFTTILFFFDLSKVNTYVSYWINILYFIFG